MAATAAGTTTTAVNVAADKAKARSLVLGTSDARVGSKVTPHKDDPASKTFDDQLAACLGLARCGGARAGAQRATERNSGLILLHQRQPLAQRGVLAGGDLNKPPEGRK